MKRTPSRIRQEKITHGGERPRTAELLEAFYRLRLFLELCLLGELGFTPEECEDVIRQAWYFHSFRDVPPSP
jgi:hypothetical protein